MDITIRYADREDYPAIVKLFDSQEELFLIYPRGSHPFTLKQLEQLAQERIALSVMEDADRNIIGFANLYDHQPGQYVFIGNVVVSKSYRGQGLGKRLVQHMLNIAEQEYRLPRIKISVFSDNTPALKLYASLGFRPYSEEQRRDPQGVMRGLIHMER